MSCIQPRNKNKIKKQMELKLSAQNLKYKSTTNPHGTNQPPLSLYIQCFIRLVTSLPVMSQQVFWLWQLMDNTFHCITMCTRWKVQLSPQASGAAAAVCVGVGVYFLLNVTAIKTQSGKYLNHGREIEIQKNKQKKKLVVHLSSRAAADASTWG